MNDQTTMRALVAAAALLSSTTALAQEQVPPGAAAPPPPPAAPAPAADPPPPPGYGAPPAYAPPGYGPPAYGPPPQRGYGYGPPDGPRVIDDWAEGDPIPPGYVQRDRIRKGLVIGGGVTMGSLWLLSSVTAAFGMAAEEAEDSLSFQDSVTQEDWAPLFVPVVGPFVAMGTLEADGAGIALLTINGVAQAGGLAMLIAGVAAKSPVLVRDYSTGFELTVSPQLGAMNGVGFTGRF